MGTYGIPYSRGLSVAEILKKELEHDTVHSKSEVVELCLKGNVGYCAIRWQSKYASTDARVYALVLKLDFGSHELFYKPIDEDMGPFYHDCPARILDQLTAAETPAAEHWRSTCRSRLQAKRETRHIIKRLKEDLEPQQQLVDGYVFESWVPRASKWIAIVRFPDNRLKRVTLSRLLELILRQTPNDTIVKQWREHALRAGL